MSHRILASGKIRPQGIPYRRHWRLGSRSGCCKKPVSASRRYLLRRRSILRGQRHRNLEHRQQLKFTRLRKEDTHVRKIRIGLFAVEISMRLALIYQLYRRVLIEQRYNELRETRNRIIERDFVAHNTEAEYNLFMFGGQN